MRRFLASSPALVLPDVLQQLVDLVDQLASVHAGLVAALAAALATRVTLVEDAVEVVFLVILWDFLHGWQPFEVWRLSVGGGGGGGGWGGRGGNVVGSHGSTSRVQIMGVGRPCGHTWGVGGTFPTWQQPSPVVLRHSIVTMVTSSVAPTPASSLSGRRGRGRAGFSALCVRVHVRREEPLEHRVHLSEEGASPSSSRTSVTSSSGDDSPGPPLFAPRLLAESGEAPAAFRVNGGLVIVDRGLLRGLLPGDVHVVAVVGGGSGGGERGHPALVRVSQDATLIRAQSHS